VCRSVRSLRYDGPMSIDVLCVLIGTYLLAAIPTGLWVVKAVNGTDLRKVGSGNTGATNVKRVLGGKWAALVMALDCIKGFVPVWLAVQYAGADSWLPMGVALVAVLAHSKSVYIGFAGGKSAATGLGCFFALAPLPIALVVAGLAFALIKLTRYVSVGSLAAAVVAPVLMALFGGHLPATLYTALAGAYVIFLHKANIQRLLAGTENRLT
jgi:acyl phosphate:glycerol-3-phosphate acyltransferase